MIRSRGSLAEQLVDPLERVGHGGVRFAQGQADNARGDAPDPVGIIPDPAGVILRRAGPAGRLQDLQHAPEVLIAHQDLPLGVQVPDPAVGGLEPDPGPAAGRVAECGDDVPDFIGDPRLQIFFPAV